MPIAVHGSTPATVSAASSTLTTTSFTPPAGSLLVACIGWERSSDAAAATTLSNTGTALTWTERVVRNKDDAGGNFGWAGISTALVGASQSITVTALSAKTGDAGGLKVFVVTGIDPVTPTGAVGEGSSTGSADKDLTVTAYTSTQPGSRAFGIAADFLQRGTPTSSDTGFGWDIAGRMSGIAVHKAADSGLAGSSVSLNFNAAAADPTWNWAALEVLPETPLAPRPYVLGQAVQRAATW
ncbi:hypothetical protein ACFSKW_54630 [Nonomuraea mangrovi]|uniref:Uncharacterized protein n=1 Tax=Nonomuraea mangrovi TaxID=2316207 RepID=A0ABW4THV5_9ACTN